METAGSVYSCVTFPLWCLGSSLRCCLGEDLAGRPLCVLFPLEANRSRTRIVKRTLLLCMRAMYNTAICATTSPWPVCLAGGVSRVFTIIYFLAGSGFQPTEASLAQAMDMSSSVSLVFTIIFILFSSWGSLVLIACFYSLVYLRNDSKLSETWLNQDLLIIIK